MPSPPDHPPGRRYRALAWTGVTRAFELLARRERGACLVVASTPLTVAYAEDLCRHLDEAVISYALVDVSRARRKTDVTLRQLRQLSRRWGAVVVFDHVERWRFAGPMIRLPHGIRPDVSWGLRADQIVDHAGRCRYAAIGLPSNEAIELAQRLVPEVPDDSFFLVGDLRADTFLGDLRDPDPRRLGVFSGWRPDSFVPSAGLEVPVLLERWMQQLGYETAVVTVHPRARTLPMWPQIERALLSMESIRFARANRWEADLTSCAAFLGDRSTSLHDVFSFTGRPVHTTRARGAGLTPELGDGLPSTRPGWPVGTAPATSVRVIRGVLEAGS